MEPVIRLVEVGKEERGVVAHACGKCRTVFLSVEDAGACCGPRRCSCGAELARNVFGRCPPCEERANADRRKKEAEDEFAAFEKATKISIREHGCEPLYVDRLRGDWGEGFFSDIHALENCEGGPTDTFPEYAWACTPQHLHLDADEILERQLESVEAYEDAGDDISADARAELQTFLDGWCARNPATTWHQNTKLAVLLDGPEHDEIRRTQAARRGAEIVP